MDGEAFKGVLREASGDARRLESLGRDEAREGRLGRAADAFRLAVEAAPGDAALRFALGTLCLRLHGTDAAAEALEACVEIDPSFAPAYGNLSALALGQGRLEDAAKHAITTLALDPAHAGALVNLGKVSSERGDQPTAIALFRRALEIDPDSGPARSNLLLALCYADVDPAELLEEHRRRTMRLEPADGSPPRPAPADPDPERKLRVGLVSRDLKTHSVAYFLTPLLRAFDREALEIHAYSDVPAPNEDAMTRTIRETVARFVRTVGLDDDALAARIREDRIDVLLDLGGHTTGNRLGVFARRAAPVQATWLGYPCTTGLAAMDWRLVDERTDPPGNELLVTERLLRMEGCAYVYEPPPDLPVVAPAPCLRDGIVSFGSFNNLAKVNAAVIRLWSRVLLEVEDSRLVLKARQLNDAPTGRLVTEAFASHGVEAGRVVLLRPPERREDHLATYGEIDVGLDPFPFNGVTTTCEALVMGVPVVTRAGRLHAGRVGATLLPTTSLGGLVAQSDDRYVEAAAYLASDRDRLARLRAGLRDTFLSSPLADAAGYARRFEAAVRTMWHDAVS